MPARKKQPQKKSGKRSVTAKSHEPTRLGTVLKDTLRDAQFSIDMDLFSIWTQWTDLMGPVVARHAHPEAIRGSLLLINVSSAPWLQELQFLKTDIVHKLNRALGKETIKDIRFQIGPVSGQDL